LTLDIDTTKLITADHVTLQAVEETGNAHEHIIPERPDDAGLKFLQTLYGVGKIAEIHGIPLVQSSDIDTAPLNDNALKEISILNDEHQLLALDAEFAQQATTDYLALTGVEVTGNAHEHTMPEHKPGESDGAGLKFLQYLHRAHTVVETEEANEAPNQQHQIVVRYGKEISKFEVFGEEDLRRKVENRWGVQEDQYQIHPVFDAQKNGAGYTVTLKVQGGKLNPMQDLRPRFGYWYREDHGLQFWRFWYRDQVCDVYLGNWIAEELIAQIQEEDPDAEQDLKVWRKGAQVMGPFEWDDIGLSVSSEPPEDEEYPDLWRWEVEIDAMAESVLMRVSPIHPLADTLRGVEMLWGCRQYHEWVAWGPVGPLVEADCRDGMTVRIRDRGEGADLQDAQVLVHCEGQELIISAQNWLQLRCRLNDIARMGSGLRGFHVYNEHEYTGFSNGTELWTYWTDGIKHWRQWEREGPDIRPKETVVVELDNTWYMVPKSDLDGAQKLPNLMRSEMAKRLHVPLEELKCVRTDDPVDPMINHMITLHSVWLVTFEAFDWTWPITIRVQVGETVYQRQIMRRQPLQLLEERLNDIPSRDEETLGIAPNGLRINSAISLYAWSNDDTLLVVHRPGGLIPVWMNFRHTSTKRNDVPIHLAERTARDWVTQTCIVPRNALRTSGTYNHEGHLVVKMMEQAHSSEQFDNVPMVYVWIRGEDNRRTQYKAQRAVDLIQQMAFEQDQEQIGTLRWCTKALQQLDPLPAEAHLTMFAPRGLKMLQGIDVFSRRGHWRVDEDDASNWLQGFRILIGDDSSWVFRNGLPWDGVRIRLGDTFWMEGELLDPPVRAIHFSSDIPLVWWKHDSLTADQIPMDQAKETLKRLRAAHRRGEIEIRRDGMLWRDERIIPGSRWEIKKIDEFDPGRLESEGKTLPLPPPVLGIRYVFWKYAPRAIPIGKDPLRWLKLSTEEWQLSGHQIVAKGDGGYGSDDEDDDDSWESLPRFPDQPDLGPRDLWDKAKCWATRVVSRGHPEMNDGQLVRTMVDLVKQKGWLWLADFFLCNVPDEVQKRLGEGMPITPNWRTVRDYFVDQWRQPGDSKQSIREGFNRAVILKGWEFYVE
jgi:hypothetical protein